MWAKFGQIQYITNPSYANTDIATRSNKSTEGQAPLNEEIKRLA